MRTWPQRARAWRDLACALVEILDPEHRAEPSRRVLARAAAENAAADAARVRRQRVRKRGLRAVPIPGPPPERARQGKANAPGRCVACGEPRPSLNGQRCPTCRQRGGLLGWCGCGAALYAEGCAQVERHEQLAREAS